MASPFRKTLLLALMVLGTAPSVALHAGGTVTGQTKTSPPPDPRSPKWSVIDNNTGGPLALNITDTFYTIGNIWLMQKDGTMKGLKNSKGNAVIPAGESYIYFDTTVLKFAVNFQIGEHQFQVTINATGGDSVTLSGPKGLAAERTILDTAGFRNRAGGTFLTFN